VFTVSGPLEGEGELTPGELAILIEGLDRFVTFERVLDCLQARDAMAQVKGLFRQRAYDRVYRRLLDRAFASLHRLVDRGLVTVNSFDDSEPLELVRRKLRADVGWYAIDTTACCIYDTPAGRAVAERVSNERTFMVYDRFHQDGFGPFASERTAHRRAAERWGDEYEVTAMLRGTEYLIGYFDPEGEDEDEPR
jgi:hypothetical protein